MKRSILRSQLVETPNVWIKHPTADTWEYGNYKCCYLSVRKTEEGKYKPCVNGCNNVRIDNWIFNDPNPLLFDTLESAQKHLFKYMDTIRDREEKQAKQNQEHLKIYLNAYVQAATAKM